MHGTRHRCIGSRARWRTAIAMLTVCVAAGSVGVALGPVGSADAATPLGPRVGVSAGHMVLWESPAERQAEMDHIAASGAKWFAMDIDWASIQPKRGAWNWGPTDAVVRDARARGLQIIGTLAYSPRWAVGPSCPPATTHCFPAKPEHFARFAREAALRYGNASPNAGLRSSITTWQIWNEANHYPFVQPTVDVAFYTEMLKQAYVAIHVADFWTTVLAGGTAPAPDDPGGRDMQPVTFLRGIYAYGGGASFDAFAHHPYSFPCSPLFSAPWNAFQQTAALYYTMAQFGQGVKKVWGTESGAPTGGDVGVCPGGPGASVTEAVQAWFVHEYLWGWTEWFKAFTGPLIWFSIRDNGLNPWVRDDNFGLLRRNFSQKPSYQVFSAMMRGG
jgi:hypothetical protein